MVWSSWPTPWTQKSQGNVYCFSVGETLKMLRSMDGNKEMEINQTYYYKINQSISLTTLTNHVIYFYNFLTNSYKFKEFIYFIINNYEFRFTTFILPS